GIDPGRAREAVSAITFDARDGAPVIVRSDESRVAPVLSKRAAREIEIVVRHDDRASSELLFSAASLRCRSAWRLVGERRAGTRTFATRHRRRVTLPLRTYDWGFRRSPRNIRSARVLSRAQIAAAREPTAIKRYRISKATRFAALGCKISMRHLGTLWVQL